MDIDSLFAFIEFTREFQRIYRADSLNSDRTDMINDAGHSFQIAMIAWYLVENGRLNLSLEKLFKYALAHDLVEVYAGDTIPQESTKEWIATKEKREADALQKIISKFPLLNDLHKTIVDYESKIDQESIVIKAIDKIIPSINTYLSKDTYYKNHKEPFKEWEKRQIEKGIDMEKLDPYIKENLINLVVKFWKEEANLFYKS